MNVKTDFIVCVEIHVAMKIHRIIVRGAGLKLTDKCQMCVRTFNSGIDFDAHNLFEHNIISNSQKYISQEIKDRLKFRYKEANQIITLTINELTYYKKAYHEFIGFGLFNYDEKYSKDRMTKRQFNNRKTKKAKNLEILLDKLDKKYDQNVHRLYTVIGDIESYGLKESDFE